MSFPNISLFPDKTEISSKGNLLLGECDAVDLVAEYGTPLYVLDEFTLREKCREFVSTFKEFHSNSSVVYASKAFINLSLAKLFNEEGLGLDVVSGGELAVAQKAEFPANKIYFHGNNKSVAELEQSLDYGIGRVVIDNFHEIDLLNDIAFRRNIVQDVLLRVSPGIDPHTHVYTTTGVLDSKFGFSIETGQALEAIRKADNLKGIRIVGLHFHLGSPIFELEPYTKAMEVVLDFAAESGLDISEISPGGGFAIAYTRDQVPPSVKDYAEAITSVLKKRDDLHLIVEPGRSIIGRAGVALYSIGSSKNIPGIRKYVSVDGGMGDNIRPALYQAEYEAVIANKLNNENLEKVSIAGKFCESGDVLLRDINFPSLDAGDILAIPAAGAYAPAMASNYNMVPRPMVIMVNKGASRVIRRRETYEDMMMYDLL